MKKNYKSILIITCLLLTSISSFAQTDIDAKRILAFEAFENEEYEMVNSIIKEIKPLFKSYPLNLHGIEIVSKYEIIQKDPTKDFDLLDGTRKSIMVYLENPTSVNNDNYSQVLKAKYKLETYPADRMTFMAKVDEIKKEEEKRKLQEEKDRKEREIKEKQEEQERIVQLEIERVNLEREKIEAEIKRKEQEVINEKRRLENEKIADENRIKQEKINKKEAREYRFKYKTFSNLGLIAGEIATYGLLYETGGANNFIGFRMALRSSLTPEEDIQNGMVTENRNEIDLGPSFKIANWLFLNLGGGYGYMNFVQNDDYYDNIATVEKREYFTGSAGLMVRLSRVISISGGASFMDIDQDTYTPEYTVGLSFNLKGKYK